MHIVMVSSEAAPFIKTGGMGEVVFGLAKELAKTNEVSILLPLYKGLSFISEEEIMKKKPFRTNIRVHIAWREEICDVYKVKVEGINYYFLRCDRYFLRDNGIYSYYDDIERFAFFTNAALEFLITLRYPPKIVHLHDWHAGLLPFLVKEQEYYARRLGKTKFVLTIHNPAYQGLLDVSGLESIYEISSAWYNRGCLYFNGMVSTLKGAILYSDLVTTVSKTYRDELLTPEHGMGFEQLLKDKKDKFIGIVNGIDDNYYSPEKDIYTSHFGIDNYTKGKLNNKRKVLEKLNLTGEDIPLISFVSRFTWQKGLGLIFSSIPRAVELGANIVIMGSGEKELELVAKSYESMYPNKVRVIIGYDEALAHLLYAGSDFTLVPSLFEPCGTSQLIAMRYGSIPIVRATGGLVDTVVPYDGLNYEKATGFSFVNFDSVSLSDTISRAIDIYLNNKWLLKRIIRNDLKTNNSWKKYAKLYLRAYNKAVGK